MACRASLVIALACAYGCTREPSPPSPPPASIAAPPTTIAAPAPTAPPLTSDAQAPLPSAPPDDYHRLRASEGALAIAPPADVTTEHAATATITLTAAPGFRVNAEFPVRLALVPPDGIAIAKPELARADAIADDDQHLVLAVQLVPHAPGSYAVTGRFKFALCQRDACFAKDEPIAIAFTATRGAP